VLRSVHSFIVLLSSSQHVQTENFRSAKVISSGQTAQTKGETLTVRDHFSQIIISLAIAGVTALSSPSNDSSSKREKKVFIWFSQSYVCHAHVCIVVFVVSFFGLALILFPF
jgi:hypothetical protein